MDTTQFCGAEVTYKSTGAVAALVASEAVICLSFAISNKITLSASACEF